MQEILKKIDEKGSELILNFLFYIFSIFSIAISHIFYFITKEK